jgi:hypothetical protein
MTQEDRRNAAVSETVGYILLFAIVTLSMGVIYAIGYPALQSNMDSTIFESAEQNFVVLQSNMKRVAYDQTPVKILKVKLQSASMSVKNESSITVSYDSENIYCPGGTIEFARDDKAINYEMGAVMKSYPPRGMVMVSKPQIYIEEINSVDVTTIGIVSVTGSETQSGKGIVSIVMKHQDSSINRSSGLTNVTLTINSKYAPKWEQYLEETGFTIANSTNPQIVIAQKNNTLLTVSKHIVDVDIT